MKASYTRRVSHWSPASRCSRVWRPGRASRTTSRARAAAPSRAPRARAGAKGDNGLEHCDKPMGAMAVVEPQIENARLLRRYNLQSPVGLIRMMIQQSNCFIVVERGRACRTCDAGARRCRLAVRLRAGLEHGRRPDGGGRLHPDAAAWSSPRATRAASAAAVGGSLGRRAAAVAGGLKFKEAQTSMLVADSRSSVQVAAAEGSTRKADLRLGAGLFGGGVGAAGGGYGNTNEGKIIAAAFMDNYNQIVGVVRNDPNLQRNVGTLAQEAAGGGTTKAGAVFNEGDVLVRRSPTSS